MAKSIKKFLKSFTLIELIIVIAIIAVLGASAFLLLSQWMSKGRDSRRIKDLRTLEKTIQIAFIDKEGANYPDPDPKVGITVGTGVDYYGVLWYQGKFGEKMTSFVGNLNKIPKDPKGNYYDYSLTEDKKYYQLLAIMENNKSISLLLGQVYGDELERTYILTNYEGYIIKKKDNKYYLIKTETIMVEPTKLDGYSEDEYEIDINNDLLKADAPYSERVEVLTGDISGLLSEDTDEQQAAMNTIQTLFPELSNTPIVDEIIQKVGATSNIQVSNTNECTAHEYSGYNFDIIPHGETQTKTKTESITDGTNTLQLSATCNNGVLTYGEESSSIECTNDKVLSNGSCVSDICQGTIPDNAQLNGTQSVSGTWGYSETGGVCKFKCIEGYNYDNGISCELNTYSVSGNIINGDGAIINVCGVNVTAESDGTFTTTRNHGNKCNDVSLTKSGYTCIITTNGPLSLSSNYDTIVGICESNHRESGIWGVCSNSCGNGTQSRSVVCKNPSSDIISDINCLGTKPSISQSCSIYTSCTYSFIYGNYGACSLTCGTGTQTRTATCERSDGVTVDSSFCGTPLTSQTCTSTSGCTYSRSIGNRGTCNPNDCRAGTKYRTVTCNRSDGTTVSDTFCTSKPATSTSCRKVTCSPLYVCVNFLGSYMCRPPADENGGE